MATTLAEQANSQELDEKIAQIEAKQKN